MVHKEYINRKIILSCKNVYKEFENNEVKETTPVKIIDNLSLDVYENEFVTLFGPGECGKSTTLNIMAGLDSPTSGEVQHDGRKVMGPGIERGVVYQSISLFPWLTVMGNVEFGPKARGVDKGTRRKKAQELIDLVGLTGFENAFPVSLSGGMKQRVGIARAYANDPEILFMDEPFGALDAQTRYMMEQEILRICQKKKRTVVFVTNNIEEAVYLSDRIIVMRACPTNVKKEYIIDLPRPRDYTSPEFLAIRQEIANVVDKTL